MEFNIKIIEETIEVEGNTYDYAPSTFGDVIYSDNDIGMKGEFEEYIDKISEYFKEFIVLTKNHPDTLPDASISFSALVTCVDMYKNREFKEDREVRIVCVSEKHTEGYKVIERNHREKLKF